MGQKQSGTYHLNESKYGYGDANGEVAYMEESNQNNSQIVSIRQTSSNCAGDNLITTTTNSPNQEFDKDSLTKLSKNVIITKTYYCENELQKVPINFKKRNDLSGSSGSLTIPIQPEISESHIPKSSQFVCKNVTEPDYNYQVQLEMLENNKRKIFFQNIKINDKGNKEANTQQNIKAGYLTEVNNH